MLAEVIEIKTSPIQKENKFDVYLKQDDYSVINGTDLVSLGGITQGLRDIVDSTVAESVLDVVIDTESIIEDAVSRANADVVPKLTLIETEVAANAESNSIERQGLRDYVNQIKEGLSDDIALGNAEMYQTILNIETSINGNVSSIEDVNTALVTNDASYTQKFSETQSSISGVSSSLDTFKETYANDQSAMSSSITELEASMTNAVRTDTEIQALANQEISASVNNGTIASTQFVQDYISTNDKTRTNEEITALAKDAITTAIDQDNLLASSQEIIDLSSRVLQNSSDIVDTNKTLASQDSAFSESISSLESRVTNMDGTEGSIATLQDTQSTYTTKTDALSTKVTSLTSKVDDHAISINETSATYATKDSVDAIKQVEIDHNGNITGWTATNGTSGSSFLIQADKFAITDQTRSAQPFSIDATTGDIQFNGKVTFGKSNITPELEASLQGSDGTDGINGIDGYTPVKGEDYFDGIDGTDGSDGDSAYNIWLSEGNSGTTTDFINSLRGQDGVDGSDGIPGTDGVDGVTTYTWVKYADSSDGSVGFSNVPTNKPYIGFAFSKTTATESNTPGDYTWSLIKGADGIDGIDGTDGYTPVKGVDYFDGIDGNDGSDGDSAYNIWLSEGNSGTTTDFINSLIGKDGVDGKDGIPGINGQDGTTTYTWIKYADSADGHTGFDNVPTGKAYIGFAFNKEDSKESTDPDHYTWSLIKGADGLDGTPGTPGSDGISVNIQFSTDGSTDWHETPTVSDTYMRKGTKLAGESIYTYEGSVKITGEDGTNGSDGLDGASAWFKWEGTKLLTKVQIESPGTGWFQDDSTGVELKGLPGTDGIDGASGTGVVIVYADTATGSNKSFTQGSKQYVLYHEYTGTKPTLANITGTWVKYIGSDGDSGKDGADGQAVWPVYSTDSSGSGQTFTQTSTTSYATFYESLTRPTLPISGQIWVRVVGKDGSDGQDGEAGTAGKSAYQSYLDTGGTLSEADWISQQATLDDINNAIANDTTVIDGSRITTGTVSADKITSGAITADKIATNTLSATQLAGGRIVNKSALNSSGVIVESLVTMDINLDNGSIYIK